MFIPFVDLKRINQSYRKDFQFQLDETINKSQYILGEPVLNFENEFSEFSNFVEF